MRILALDIATTTGWAFGEPNTEPEWGSASFRGGSLGARISRFEDWIDQMIGGLAPHYVVIEKPLMVRYIPNLDTSRLLLGFTGVVEKLCYRRDVRVCEAHNAEWKKAFIGHASRKGRSIKADCIAKCAQHGWHVDDDNEADALGIWSHACDEFTQSANRLLGKAVA